MQGSSAFRERAIVFGAIAGLVAAAWLYIVRTAGAASTMSHMTMTSPASRLEEWAMLFLMWLLMMIAMMTPSATPMVAIFDTVNRRRAERGDRGVSTLVFLGGYLLVWGFYSVVVSGLQLWLQGAAVVSTGAGVANARLAGMLLIVAGAFQWTRLKRTCLTQCQSPMSFLSRFWRDGIGGALRMGVRHGSFCVGCCWAIMLLLFVAGVMNLLWVVALGLFVLVEKLVTHRQLISRVAGAAMIVAGVILLIR